MTSKKIIIFSVLLGILFSPLVFAKAEANGVCNLVKTFSGQLKETVRSRVQTWTEKREERGDGLETKRTEQDAKREEIRQRWEERREEQFANLEAKATTEEQKQALARFKEAVNTAILNRRLAFDTAKEAFRTGVDQIIASKKQLTDNAVNAYRNTIEAALQNAESACEDGADMQTLRTQFRNALKQGKDDYNEARTEVEAAKETMQTLIETRKAAMEKAQADFQTAMEAARERFQEEWGASE